MKHITIHATDTREFRECRWRWHWGGKGRQNLELREPLQNDARRFGTAIHKALEAWYMTEGNFVQAVATLDIYNEKWGDSFNYDLARGMVAHYAMMVNLEDEEYVPLYAERPFKVLLHHEPRRLKVWLAGTWDLVIASKATERIYVWDHKTAATPKIEDYYTDEQMIAYAIAGEIEFGDLFDGIVMNVLKKGLPAMPQPRKDGLLPDYTPDTTYEVYLQHILDLGLDPETPHHRKHLDILASKPNQFIQRGHIAPNRAQKEYVRDTLVQVALDMHEKSLRLYPSPSPIRCNQCEFRGPCEERRSGGPWELMLHENYAVKGERYDTDTTPQAPGVSGSGQGVTVEGGDRGTGEGTTPETRGSRIIRFPGSYGNPDGGHGSTSDSEAGAVPASTGPRPPARGRRTDNQHR
jgi:hypothetical protein